MLICLPAFAQDTEGFDGFSSVEHLPPGEQFRQLSLMLLMAGKTGPEFNDLLSSGTQAGNSANLSGNGGTEVMPDDYRAPLIRIVDQESMLIGAVRIFSFVQDNFTDISKGLQNIKQDNPVLISMVDTSLIMEDAIIVRNAIADSLVFLDYEQDDKMASLIGDYRIYTLFLRNQMEYAEYYEELEKITNAAVANVSRKTDAYQRMFDDEFESEAVDRYIEASEFSTEQRLQNDRRAALLTEEILQGVIDAQIPAKP